MEHPIKNKRNPRVNNPEPKDQALTSPKIGGLGGRITRETMECRRSVFVMEIRDIADLCQPYKNRPHSTKRGFSIFQHSIIPTCPAEVTPRRDEGGYPITLILRANFDYLLKPISTTPQAINTDPAIFCGACASFSQRIPSRAEKTMLTSRAATT